MRRPASISLRSRTCSGMLVSKKHQPLLPLILACDMARCALRSTSAADWDSPEPNRVMPMLADPAVLGLVQLIGPAQRRQRILCDLFRLACRFDLIGAEVVQQYHELVTAQARHGLLMGYAGHQSIG